MNVTIHLAGTQITQAVPAMNGVHIFPQKGDVIVMMGRRWIVSYVIWNFTESTINVITEEWGR